MHILKTISESRFMLRRRPRGGLPLLTIGALGVVYGDIGTSPLYAVNEIFFGHGKLAASTESILGAIGLIVWVLTIVISLKYIIFVLRADNDGEGGVFALLQFIQNIPWIGIAAMSAFLIFAAGLLFGEAVITPAISVLAATEGLGIVTPLFQTYVIPLTIGILTLLFALQHKGTAKVGMIFGPIVVVWFFAIGILGIHAISAHPEILAAFNPLYALRFLQHITFHTALLVLGAVMLAVTGGEALYADMGHFGKRPIRIGWFALVYPALILNYLGQGAYLLSGQAATNGNIFYSMVPRSQLFPMVILATCATVVASQALISGVFSLARQAMSLDLIPRLRVVYTHAKHEGQVYIPFVNWVLYIACVVIVLFFKTPTALAGAYGLAVSGLMVATSLAMIGVARAYWRWSIAASVALFGAFALLDAIFLFANSLKFLEGGFVPFGIGVLFFIIMTTWRWGRRLTHDGYNQYHRMNVAGLIKIKSSPLTPVLEKSAIMMSMDPVTSPDDKVPPIAQFFWERYAALPKDIIFLTVTTTKEPYIYQDRYDIAVFQNKDSGTGGSVAAVTLRFGFMEIPDVESVLAELAAHREIHLPANPDDWLVEVVMGRLIPSPDMGFWRKISFHIFRTLRNLTGPSYYFYGLGKEMPLSLEMIPVKIR